MLIYSETVNLQCLIYSNWHNANIFTNDFGLDTVSIFNSTYFITSFLLHIPLTVVYYRENGIYVTGDVVNLTISLD